MTPKTMFEKIWDAHIVHEIPGETTILYIDTHLVHEITSAQAFEGIRLTGRKVRRPDLTFATMDHNVPTTDRFLPIQDLIAAKQMEVLAENCAEAGITLYDRQSPNQGIVHVIGPGARHHPTGEDYRLRRQPHLNTRCVGDTCHRHWDQ